MSKSNHGAGHGRSCRASKEYRWKAFDRLPRSVRDALNDAVCPWSAYSIWRRWNRGGYKDAKEVVKRIQRRDREWLEKVDKARAKGRFIALALIAGIAAFVLSLSAAPGWADYCEIVGCERQCFPIPGGVRCATRCHRRCWHVAPRYEEPYRPPVYAQPAATYTPRASYPSPEFPPEIAAGIGLLFLLVIAAVLGAAGSDPDNTAEEIRRIERSAVSARALAQDAQNTVEEIDAAVAAVEREHFEAGRKAAEDEWNAKDWTKHE